jgi:very-short-patch-repair endonuclease
MRGETPMRGANSKTTNRSRSLRKVNNDAEAKFWTELRNRRLNGYKFVRELPIGKYFADFACREQRLVVELDGSHHAQSTYDTKRDLFMNEEGWSVLRFWNFDVFGEMEPVLETVLAALEGRLEAVVESVDVRFYSATRIL